MAEKQYDDTNTGILYRNEEKDDSHPNWPDFKGNANLEGTEYWVSGWVKEAKQGKLKGKKFFSLAFQEKETRRDGGSKSSGGDRSNPRDDKPPPGNDDIPF